MNLTPRLIARWSWLALAIVLLLLGTASWLILRQNFNDELSHVRASSERELRTIAAFVSSELQAGRYQDIERLLRDWGETNPGIAHLQLVAANGFVLATYQRAGEVEHALTLDLPISYSYRGEAKLHMRLDLAEVNRHQQRLVTEFTIIFAVGAVLLALLVHVALQRQREAARLRQHAHELERSEQRFRAVLENMQLIGVMLDRDGHIILCNDFLLQLTGWQRAEVLHRSWFEIFLPPDIREQIKESAFLETLRGGNAPAHYQNEIVTRRGERRMIAWNNTVFRDPQGQVLNTASIGEDITERLQAEREGGRMQAFLDSVIENLPTMLFVKDAQALRFVRFNKAAEELLGYSRHEMLGQNDYDIFPGEEADFFTAKDRAVLNKGVLHDIPEEPIHTKYQGVRLLHTKKIPIMDETGKPLYLLGISEDITERRRAEEALRNATERFRQALRAARAGAWEWNIVTNQATWSEENFAVLGLDPHTHQASFENWLACVHPEDRERSTRGIKEALDAGSDLNLEFRVLWPNGEVRWINDVGRLVYDKNGKPASMYGIQLDITERKQAEQLREAGVRQLHAIINASPVPKALNDGHQNIIFLNPAFTQTFGYTREDIPTLADWWPKAYPDPEYRRWVADTWQATLDKCQREGTAFPPMELDVRCQNGTVKTVLASANPIGKSFEGVHLVVLYDITERKHTDAEREGLLAELTARNIEMESFVYTISHDLKSPLITIGGFASLLEKDLARHDGAAAADSIAEIKKAAADMQRLIENLLQLARLGQIAGEPREVDVNALLEELRARCARHIERERATVRIAPDIPRLRVDPVRLGEALQNLVENALKYHRPGIPPEIDIGWRHEQGWFRLYVRDNGIGIKQEYQERIFGLFQRLDSHAEGTGVGLTIARRIIESFGGRLGVESEPGQGSTFWIDLPESVMVAEGAWISGKDIEPQG